MLLFATHGIPAVPAAVFSPAVALSWAHPVQAPAALGPVRTGALPGTGLLGVVLGGHSISHGEDPGDMIDGSLVLLFAIQQE